jgi:hypothetical protein
MGKIKQANESKTFILDEDEFNYLKILNYSLALNVMKDKVISGFLHHLCRLKYDYADNINLSFEIDLNDETKRELKVREVTDEQAQSLSSAQNPS